LYCGKKGEIWGFFTNDHDVNPCYKQTEDEHISLVNNANETQKIIRFNQETGEPYLADPPPLSEPELAAHALTERNRIFAETVDRKCNVAHWEDMTEERREEWRLFRRALRDIDKQDNFPHKIEWPISPEDRGSAAQPDV
jgi:hypothetical protein